MLACFLDDIGQFQQQGFMQLELGCTETNMISYQQHARFAQPADASDAEECSIMVIILSMGHSLENLPQRAPAVTICHT